MYAVMSSSHHSDKSFSQIRDMTYKSGIRAKQTVLLTCIQFAAMQGARSASG